MMHTPRQYAMPRHRSSDSFTQVEHPTQIRPGRSRRLHLVNGDVSGIRVNTKTRDRPQKATGRSMTKACNTSTRLTQLSSALRTLLPAAKPRCLTVFRPTTIILALKLILTNRTRLNQKLANYAYNSTSLTILTSQ